MTRSAMRAFRGSDIDVTSRTNLRGSETGPSITRKTIPVASAGIRIVTGNAGMSFHRDMPLLFDHMNK